MARLRKFVGSPIRELPPQDAYRLWAPTYLPYPHNLLMQVEQRAVLDLMPPIQGTRVLDLACGSGRYAAILLQRGAQVAALDRSFEMLERAESRLSRTQGDLYALPLADASADGIVCGLAVGHLADLRRGLREMARVLKPRGALVYSDFHAAGEALGWKRTFRANGQTYAVRHYARTENEHTAACTAAGLRVEAVRAVTIPDDPQNPEAAAFHRRWAETPVVLVVRAVRL